MIARRNEIDCSQAMDHLYGYLDGELTPEVSEQIREHLKRCAQCFPLFNFEKAYLRFLEARARTKSAPPELKRRILEQLLTEEADTD